MRRILRPRSRIRYYEIPQSSCFTQLQYASLRGSHACLDSSLPPLPRAVCRLERWPTFLALGLPYDLYQDVNTATPTKLGLQGHET